MSILLPGIAAIRSRLRSKFLFNPSERLFRPKPTNPYGYSYSTAWPPDTPSLLEDDSGLHGPDRFPSDVISNSSPIRQAPPRIFENDENDSNHSSLRNYYGENQEISQQTDLLEINYTAYRGAGSMEIGQSANPLADKDSITRAVKRVSDALRRGDPHELLSALSHASKDPSYIGSIPATTFTEICRLLDPEIFIGPYAAIHAEIHPRPYETTEHPGPRIRKVFADYSEILREIISQRTEHRQRLGFQEYKLLLNLARCLRDGEMASKIWADMQRSAIDPDTICYNHYFEAICWTGTFNSTEREKLRVVLRHLNIRAHRDYDIRHRFWGPLVGYRTGEGGLKSHVTNTFSLMVKNRVMADAKTFSLLMTALSREGDIQAVKSVLNKVWDVDVDEIILSDGDENVSKPVYIRVDSPLYPTSNLLFVVAHIFGSNNNVPAALRIVDYISRRYNIPIDQRTWGELLDWAFVLSCPRTATTIEPDKRTGQLPLKSVTSLWETMVAPQYGCKPSIYMHGRYIRNAEHQKNLELMLRIMIKGVRFYLISNQNYVRSCDILCEAEENGAYTTPDADPFNSIYELEQKMRLAMLGQCRDFLMINRWLCWLLAEHQWYGGTKGVVLWQRIKLPLAIQAFWHFRLEAGIRYRIATGFVELGYDDEIGFPSDSTEI